MNAEIEATTSKKDTALVRYGLACETLRKTQERFQAILGEVEKNHPFFSWNPSDLESFLSQWQRAPEKADLGLPEGIGGNALEKALHSVLFLVPGKKPPSAYLLQLHVRQIVWSGCGCKEAYEHWRGVRRETILSILSLSGFVGFETPFDATRGFGLLEDPMETLRWEDFASFSEIGDSEDASGSPRGVTCLIGNLIRKLEFCDDAMFARVLLTRGEFHVGNWGMGGHDCGCSVPTDFLNFVENHGSAILSERVLKMTGVDIARA